MRVRKLTPAGDYTFGNGLSGFYHDEPLAVGNKISERLKLFLGEWFLDSTDGTPWYQEIFGIRQNPTYDLAIQSRILTTQGVTKIVSYNSQLTANIIENGVPARKLFVRAQILTIYSTQPVTLEITI